MWFKIVRLYINNCAKEWTHHNTFPKGHLQFSTEAFTDRCSKDYKNSFMHLFSHAPISNSHIKQITAFGSKTTIVGSVKDMEAWYFCSIFNIFIHFFHLLNFAFSSKKPRVMACVVGLPASTWDDWGPGLLQEELPSAEEMELEMTSYPTLRYLCPEGELELSVVLSDDGLQNEPVHDIASPFRSVSSTPTCPPLPAHKHSYYLGPLLCSPLSAWVPQALDFINDQTNIPGHGEREQCGAMPRN